MIAAYAKQQTGRRVGFVSVGFVNFGPSRRVHKHKHEHERQHATRNYSKRHRRVSMAS
jgi:hypothetical protein